MILTVRRFLLGERGQYGSIKSIYYYLPIIIIQRIAKRRRQLGWYDKQTLALFRYCWFASRNAQTLLAYILFRRDLGLMLPNYYANLLQQNLTQLSTKQRHICLNLLAELNISFINDKVAINNTQHTIITKQMLWHEQFKQWLISQNSGGICVVGNSGSLLHQHLGQLIDTHQIVVRFNHFQSKQSNSRDIGKRINIWVTSPSCPDNVPANVSWVLLTGTVAFKLKNWTRFEKALQNDCRILTVPFSQWRDLVKQLQAPPSAGILFLAWLRYLLGSWQNIRAIGFGYSSQNNTRYHHAHSYFMPANRHHWSAELQLLQTWQTEGLQLDFSH